jgi:hypothetical protein
MKPISNLTAHALLIPAVLLCPISCSRESADKGPAHSAGQVVQPVQGERGSRSAPNGAAQPELPAIGEIVILPSDETVTVLANQVSVARLAEHLSDFFAFELVLLEFEDRLVRVFAVDTTMAEVLELALEGIPYAVRYGVENERSRLEWLAVGGGEEAIAGLKRGEGRRGEDEWKKRKLEQKEEGKERRVSTRPRRPGDSFYRDRFLAERANREEVRWNETLDDLESRDPDARRRGVEMLDPETSADVDYLASVIAQDDDIRVRVAAVEQLEFSESQASVEAITQALWDPEAEVVVAALKALRLLGDSSTVSTVQPLLDHESSEVRNHAEELVDLLQESEPAE